MMIIGRYGEDETLLRVAHAFEQLNGLVKRSSPSWDDLFHDENLNLHLFPDTV